MKRIAAFVLCCSCGTSATIQTIQGGYYEGRITGHDRGHVFIQGRKVLSEDITDVDHPGNVAAWIGGIVAGIGALSAQHNCKEEVRAIEGDTPCQSSGLWLLTGIPIMVYGIITHSESKSRAGQ